ncbi:MAG: DEAD/DEAH box helicase [Bdellovibrio sp. CG12_big_fil_rev_8_21_14_0_65_39_13]|nr:MAG: DEAD/DEAH box helicase [Bdellovibrio sp. CG22_combo_CG10-13_8_21_14_all_39_27]PIQ60379.1 MAG: DEAD/DEAH box helicase [Bdellovibrio sp. CG12_big_fil_rev_8_21_14_0_65_39_13]PIR35012.1 MAG: DEAD/DEAH box helicase [Bdellovibrio sp. CG11_big_fil_rev_8_21_14_0_20_39_38]
MTDFNSFSLLPTILEALANKGYTSPTPIQEQAIPHLLNGRDLLGIAQTGTGKTAAFSLPIINRLFTDKKKAKPARMRSLILTPTRELAAQINDNVKTYSKGLGLKSAVIYGGVAQKPQVEAMVRGVDILIATPGRLLDLINEGHVLFDQLEVFVLDEADRMLDMGFIRDIEKIVKLLPAVRQTMLFSATMPNDIARIANKLLKNPERVEVTPESTTVEKIEQKVNMIDGTLKPIFLKHILKDQSIKSVLVFTRTKHGADRVVRHLEKDRIQSAAIHGNKSQNARERALGDFKAGKIRVLVATDIAARGIDISQVSHVINYNLPEDPKSYVHRIGRTARAGRSGVAISFCDESEVKFLKGIEKLINIKIPVDKSHLSMHRN